MFAALPPPIDNVTRRRHSRTRARVICRKSGAFPHIGGHSPGRQVVFDYIVEDDVIEDLFEVAEFDGDVCFVLFGDKLVEFGAVVDVDVIDNDLCKASTATVVA